MAWSTFPSENTRGVDFPADMSPRKGLYLVMETLFGLIYCQDCVWGLLGLGCEGLILRLIKGFELRACMV